uniref:histidine kinase n=1 Tax=Magnetococcus massalia (strain MO-1) TaxID=451514 RepID=A0A1S7LI95_MAGMO|nr:putative Histidine kinase with two bacterial extracellular solute-binding protein domains and one response regulator receiver domain, one HisKA domain and one HATPase domain [Candidatus Magnetococcus massalia]
MLITLLGIFMTMGDGHAGELELTPQEQQFIAEHPVLRVANEMDWPPFDYYAYGEPKGLAIDFIQLLARKSGLKLEFINGLTWAELLKQFQARKIDVMPVMYRNKQREAYTLFTRAYYRGKLGVLTRKDGAAIEHLSDLVGIRVGIQASHGAISIIQEKIPEIRFIERPSYDTLVKMLGTDRLDAVVGNPLLFSHFAQENQIQNLQLSQFIPMSSIEQAETSFHVGVRPDYPTLHGILDKAIAAVSDAEMKQLVNRWNPSFQADEPDLPLTHPERALLSRMGQLTICVDPAWMPFEQINAQGKHEGIAADFMALIAKRLGVEVNLYPTTTWDESLQAVRERRCDLIPLAMSTPARHAYLKFTTPVLQAPHVVATRGDQLFIEDITQHAGETFTVVQGYALIDGLKRRYPQLRLKEVANIREGLQQVIDGQAMGYIGTTAAIGYIRHQMGMCDIKIAAQLESGYDLSMATRSDLPLLLTIMQKAVDAITPAQMQQIQQKWMAVNLQKVTDYRLILQVAVIFSLLLISIIYWNRRLQREVAKRQEAEKALLQAKSEAERANRAKSEFLAVMSHEIRTPLNVLLGMSDVLQESSLSDQQRSQLGMVHDSGNHLLTLINDILDLSKIEVGAVVLDTAPFQPHALFTQVGEMMGSRAAERDLTFELKLATGLPDWVMGDEGRLRQVLINLLSNAVKFTEVGKVLFDVTFDAAQDHYRMAIEDSGEGISPEHLEHIFDKFTQADASISRRYGGSGLGLAISENLIELMGGGIRVTSQLGRGSRFEIEITLPSTAAPAAEQQEGSVDSTDVTERPFRPLRLLLVDDSKDNQTLIQTYLKQTPWQVDTAMDGLEALQRITSGEVAYDLVLMDIQMPVMDGYTATEKIRAWEKEQGVDPLPVLALSAHALESEQRKSLAVGCDAHLTKPIKKKRLIEVIQKVSMDRARASDSF